MIIARALARKSVTSRILIVRRILAASQTHFFEAPWFSCRKEQAAKGRYASQRVDAFRPVRGFNSAAKNLILLPVLARVASKELS